MRSNTVLNAIVKTAALAGMLLASGVSHAADVNVYLQTQSYLKDLFGTIETTDDVRMWGFTRCTDDTFTSCDLPAANSTGPQIDAEPGDTLTIYLSNTLPTPVSIIVPGQTGGGAGTPVMDGTRVQSFTHETAATTGTNTYTFTSVRPGTYLYQSGTHPSIQVPMGLYGALVVGPVASADCAIGQAAAYMELAGNSVSCYDDEAVMLFSEVDPAQNAAVDAANGNFGLYPSTVNYNPSYLLVNGELSASLAGIGDDTTPDDGTDAVASTVLLRLLNAGSRTHTPAIVGSNMALIAEDGNLYPGLPLQQAQALLPAGKTLDAIINAPAENVTFGLYDRTPDFTNADLPQGGMIANVVVNDGSPPPTDATTYAVDDTYAVTEDTLSYAGATVLGNDVGLVAPVSVTEGVSTANGELTLLTDGSFTYTPNPDFSGADSFTYSALDGSGNSYGASVTLNVSFENDAPVAAADGPYVNTVGMDIVVDAAHGVLGNDADPDGDTLTAVVDAAPTGGTLTLAADGSFTYTGGALGDTSFTYHVNDGTTDSGIATAQLTVNEESGIALTVQEPGGGLVPDYRWTLEEDTMWQPDPGSPDPVSLATDFHRSYMPVVAQGIGAAEFALLALDSTKHYYVSVLPLDATAEDDTGYRLGHTIGGAQIQPGASAVTVIVNKQPLPYAQISAFIFEDNGPTNGAVDGGELGLGGFQITLEDAGGRYGISAGQLSQDADGNLLTNALDCFGGATPPPGVILSCPDTPANQAAGLVGEVLIKNLFPGKYGVITNPPLNAAEQWVQTSTIEGTKVIDAWVKAGEPQFFSEFGPAGWHVFTGFVSPERANTANPGGSNSVTGKVTNLHMSRPPNQTLADSNSYDAMAHTRAWVGLNSEGGIGTNIAAVQADSDGNFTISGVPDGEFQLVVWDSYLDQVIGYKAVSLPSGGALGNVPVFQWFARLENNVFLDDGAGGGTAGDGIRNGDEAGLPEQAVNLRWRDGSVYQSFPTDLDGFVPFDQVFPFFHWLVAEVDYTRFEATGLTVTVDHGGDPSVGPYPGVLNPQIQTEDCTTTDCFSRTETGQILTQGFQGFLGQTSVFDWGKRPYEVGKNGGISGIVYSGITRAESDPRLTAAEPWETGIPRVTVRLHREIARDPMDVDTNLGTLEFPIASEGDIDLNSDGVFDGPTTLTLVTETETDSWDDNLPVNCPGADPSDPVTPNDKCYDGLRNFNQARPAVFDGGYAFNDIPAGTYVVEVVPPAGWELLKEEDVNVSYGDGYASVFVMMPGGAVVNSPPDPAIISEAQSIEPGIAQPPCVGEVREVPQIMSLFPAAAEEAPFAGALRPLCDRKRVILSDQGQAAADFTLFTGAPVSAHAVGMVLDDVAQEFNPLSIQFGEKWAPPFVPISIRDYKGYEISRVYSDEWGRYNALVPSTYTANMPSPSGFSPNMLMTCMNDPGPLADGSIDPQYNPAYSNFCYTFQYMPGTTTYLDTPVLPIASFASGYNPADCALDDFTPMISQVNGIGVGPLVAADGTLTITSMGTEVAVPNPAYEGPASGMLKTITRDFGFGDTAGSVMLNGTLLAIESWDADTIEVQVGSAETGQLVVTHANGNSTEHAITVTVSNETPIRVTGGSLPGEHKLQMAIDLATPGDLILVGPGVYHESVIMWKPVRLQGAGAGSTFINAIKAPTESLQQWRDKMDDLFTTNSVDALPVQLDGAAGFDNSEGAGITVLGLESGADTFSAHASRIDGLSITGGDVGGGIMVNGYAHDLEIANNHVFGNSGSFHGGIRVGQPFLDFVGEGPFGFNNDVNIHHNSITQNGGLGGAGGGLSIATGTDSYTVSNNYVCGNFTTGDGGGIGHLGLSDGGMISNNRIVLNQSYNQGVTVSGGGLFIGGEPAAGALTLGAGNVTADANFIQGNQAGAGHGGGIRTQFINGLDIDRPAVNQWHTITLTNNMVVNNLAGWSGAGVALQDTLRSIIVNNTIAHNDSTATVGALINTNSSVPQPAGLSSMPHSDLLEASIPDNRAEYKGFSNPTELVNNIAWQNRAFYYDAAVGLAELQPVLAQSAVGECPSTTAYWDMGVLGGANSLSPTYSVLSTTQGTVIDPSNTTAEPALADVYCNGGRVLASAPGSMLALPALDEGGNAWIDVRFGPLDVRGDYHITGTSSAIDTGTRGSPKISPALDYDGDVRPTAGGASAPIDIGADEWIAPPPPPLPTVVYSSGDFGDVQLGDTATLDITATVVVGPVTFNSHTDPALPFAIDGTTCTGTVIEGGSCAFTVTYAPAGLVASVDSFDVSSDADDSPQTVALSGTGVPAELGAVTATSATDPGVIDNEGSRLNFGVLPNGNFDSLITFTINGSYVTFGNLMVTGNRFSMSTEDGSDTCSGITFADGETCQVRIDFVANGRDTTRTGTLLMPNDGTGLQTLDLTGE